MIRLILLGLTVTTAAGLLFVNLYNSFVDAPNWGADLPNSITAARDYFSATNPGNFYRIFSPLNQVFALGAVIACWKFRRERYIAIASLVIAVLADVLTFGYFYPRNEILFFGPMEGNIDNIRLAWEQWTSMNWFRSAVCAVNSIFALVLFASTSRKLAL